MKKNEVTLLQRAKGDLRTAKQKMQEISDDVDIDIAAYHCAQCIEKAVKYVINLQGDLVSPSHVVADYIVDLRDDKMKELVLSVEFELNRWNNQIRYTKTLMSSKLAVERVIPVCQSIISYVDSLNPVIASDVRTKPAKNTSMESKINW